MVATHPPQPPSLDDRVLRLERIVDGVAGEDQPGLRERVRELEKLGKDVRQLILALRVAIILAGVYLVGSVPGFVAWLVKLLAAGS